MVQAQVVEGLIRQIGLAPTKARNIISMSQVPVQSSLFGWDYYPAGLQNNAWRVLPETMRPNSRIRTSWLEMLSTQCLSAPAIFGICLQWS